MTSIRVRDGEPMDQAMRRFKRGMDKSGKINELRGRDEYTKPSTQRRRDAAAARKRESKRRAKSAFSALGRKRAADRKDRSKGGRGGKGR